MPDGGKPVRHGGYWAQNQNFGIENPMGNGLNKCVTSHLRIKDQPAGERPRERLIQVGVAVVGGNAADDCGPQTHATKKSSLNGILTHLFADVNLQRERHGINDEYKREHSNSLDVHSFSLVHVHASLILNVGDFFVIRV